MLRVRAAPGAAADGAAAAAEPTAFARVGYYCGLCCDRVSYWCASLCLCMRTCWDRWTNADFREVFLPLAFFRGGATARDYIMVTCAVLVLGSV